MTETTPKSMDKIALGLCLGGVVLAIVAAMVGRLLDHNFTMMAYGVFVAFQIAALVLGIVTRTSPLGKAAAITSGILLVGSFLFMT